MRFGFLGVLLVGWAAVLVDASHRTPLLSLRPTDGIIDRPSNADAYPVVSCDAVGPNVPVYIGSEATVMDPGPDPCNVEPRRCPDNTVFVVFVHINDGTNYSTCGIVDRIVQAAATCANAKVVVAVNFSQSELDRYTLPENEWTFPGIPQMSIDDFPESFDNPLFCMKPSSNGEIAVGTAVYVVVYSAFLQTLSKIFEGTFFGFLFTIILFAHNTINCIFAASLFYVLVKIDGLSIWKNVGQAMLAMQILCCILRWLLSIDMLSYNGIWPLVMANSLTSMHLTPFVAASALISLYWEERMSVLYANELCQPRLFRRISCGVVGLLFFYELVRASVFFLRSDLHQQFFEITAMIYVLLILGTAIHFGVAGRRVVRFSKNSGSVRSVVRAVVLCDAVFIVALIGAVIAPNTSEAMAYASVCMWFTLEYATFVASTLQIYLLYSSRNTNSYTKQTEHIEQEQNRGTGFMPIDWAESTAERYEATRRALEQLVMEAAGGNDDSVREHQNTAASIARQDSFRNAPPGRKRVHVSRRNTSASLPATDTEPETDHVYQLPDGSDSGHGSNSNSSSSSGYVSSGIVPEGNVDAADDFQDYDSEASVSSAENVDYGEMGPSVFGSTNGHRNGYSSDSSSYSYSITDGPSSCSHSYGAFPEEEAVGGMV